MTWPWSSKSKSPEDTADTRAVIVASARRLFSSAGYMVPFSAIAQDAGVRQSEMYAIFASRLHLAIEVFAENLNHLEELAGQVDDPKGFSKLWNTLIEYVVESGALLEMVLAEQDFPSDVEGGRLVQLLTEPLSQAQIAGLADPAWTPEDLRLIVQMVSGITSETPEDRRADVYRALALIDERLVPIDGEIDRDTLAEAV